MITPAITYRSFASIYNVYISIRTFNDYDAGGIFLITMKNPQFKWIDKCQSVGRVNYNYIKYLNIQECKAYDTNCENFN